MMPFWCELASVAGFIALVVMAWSCVLMVLDHLSYWILERRRERSE